MNVIIVDDEPIIRIGLRTLIDWEQHGFTLVGEASDGEEALELIEQNSVDLLVTDIRMPRMDGLELIREARQRSHDMGIVVISCLDDFSFVKEAMKLGAYDYILKPTMEPDELLQILKVIRAKLTEERLAQSHIRELNARLAQSKPYRLQAQIVQFIENGQSDVDLNAELFHPDKALYSIMVCSSEGASLSIRESEHQDVVVAVRLQDNQQLLLLECERGISTNDWYQLSYSTSKKLLPPTADAENNNGDSEASYLFFVGPPIYHLNDLPKRIAFHRQQFVARFYGDCTNRIYMEAPIQFEHTELLPVSLRNNLLRAIAGGNSEGMRHHMQELLGVIGQAKPDVTKLHAFVFESIGLAIGYARDNGYSGLSELEQRYFSMDMLSSFYQFEDLRNWLTSFIVELAESKDGFIMKRDIQHPFIRKALAYIHDNYANNIGTADIADYVKLSRSYLSDLYSKEVGESLTETLTRVRIDEACKLLNTTDKKIYEIAEQVGFNDSKTFTKTFKRIKGCSPKEYPISNK